MHVMEYCCIIVMHVFTLRFQQYSIIYSIVAITYNALRRIAFPYFQYWSECRKVQGSISNKLMEDVTMIFVHISPDHAFMQR